MNYWDYIKVEELLSLQGGVGDRPADSFSNDEVLFITVHQIYELWFKLVLRELETTRSQLRQNPVPDEDLAEVTRSLRRCVTIFEVAANHFRVMETMTTRDYLAFRDHLIGASGFQSAQMREMEIVLGLHDDKRLPAMGDESYKEALKGDAGKDSPALARVERRQDEGGSLRDALYAWLARTPVDGSSDEGHVERYLQSFVEAHEEGAKVLLETARERVARPEDVAVLEKRYRRDVEAATAFLKATDKPEEERPFFRHVRAALVFIESHRELPRLSWPREVIDAVIALEQAMVIWRQRHARMVERMIGRRVGTGGSGGVDYLDQTALRYRVFEDLWAVRTILLRQSVVPDLEHTDDYRLRIQD